MRLWTVHPRHLDSKGLVALWREALLAKKVLAGKTRGYRHHPQLIRFRGHPVPGKAIAYYLWIVRMEAQRRGYAFDGRKARWSPRVTPISETMGQLNYEWRHLGRKLRRRSTQDLLRWKVATMSAHPIFSLKSGGVRSWELTP